MNSKHRKLPTYSDSPFVLMGTLPTGKLIYRDTRGEAKVSLMHTSLNAAGWDLKSRSRPFSH